MRHINKTPKDWGYLPPVIIKNAFSVSSGDNTPLEVVKHLKQYARDRIMKADQRAAGFYEAIDEIERYYDIKDESTPIYKDYKLGERK